MCYSFNFRHKFIRTQNSLNLLWHLIGQDVLELFSAELLQRVQIFDIKSANFDVTSLLALIRFTSWFVDLGVWYAFTRLNFSSGVFSAWIEGVKIFADLLMLSTCCYFVKRFVSVFAHLSESCFDVLLVCRFNRERGIEVFTGTPWAMTLGCRFR